MDVVKRQLPLRRRGVLLGLLAAQCRLFAGVFGPALMTLGAGRAKAQSEDDGKCDQAGQTWATQRRGRIVRALWAGFGVQYWGDSYTAARLVAAPHGLFILEAARVGASLIDNSREVFFSAEEMRRIGQEGQRPILGYLNLAKIEPYRDYWIDAVAAAGGRDTLGQQDAPWIGPQVGSDGTLARFWTQEWAAILAERVDGLMGQGVDGLFLDDVLQYFAYYAAQAEGQPEFSSTDGPSSAAEFARAMMVLVVAVADRARLHGCKSLIIVNNGVFIGRDAGNGSSEMFDRYRAAIDGILIESVFAAGGNTVAIAALQQDFAAEGIPVLTIEFADAAGPEGEAAVTAAKTRAASEGFAAYVAQDAMFNRLYAPIPLVAAVKAAP